MTWLRAVGAAAVLLTTVGCAGAPSGAESQPPVSSSPPSQAAAPASPKAPTTTNSPAPTGQPRTDAAAAAAFKRWVKQYGKEDWDAHYRTLVTEQQKVITAKRYTNCRNKKTSPTFQWIKVVRTTPNVRVTIPGTSVTKKSTVVVVRLLVANAYKLPVTAHMFYEDGEWRWSMTKENMAGCKK